KCRDAHGIIVQGIGFFGAAVLEALPRCLVVATTGVGYDAYDVAAATRLGIAICRNPGINATEVADHAMALILSLTRNVYRGASLVKEGESWPSAIAKLGSVKRLEGQTLGILGFGFAGKALAKRAAGFGFQLLACDPYTTPEMAAEYGVTLVDKDELFRRSS